MATQRTVVIPLVLFAVIASGVALFLITSEPPPLPDPSSAGGGEVSPEPRAAEAPPEDPPDFTGGSVDSPEDPDPPPADEPLPPIDTRVAEWQEAFTLEERPYGTWPAPVARAWGSDALVLWIREKAGRRPAVGTLWLEDFGLLTEDEQVAARALLDATARAAYVTRRFEQETISRGGAKGPFPRLSEANAEVGEGERVHAVSKRGPYHVVGLGELEQSRLAFVLRTRVEQSKARFPGAQIGLDWSAF